MYSSYIIRGNDWDVRTNRRHLIIHFMAMAARRGSTIIPLFNAITISDAEDKEVRSESAGLSASFASEVIT
ncbi:hypothetical protein T12_8644 [Trichinella patagoniensis]|uniref:Uncharacterized protein n=1 Tax=Trichinella patagoniensis TaxID=990121 RepID=A0A0V0ZP33_9BILA|nr:hypothetical protein T12_13423 [Trichinella patagoniensis]KRY17524.1 hypothetical protein T12_8644 [Trichinella patagoniensis]